MTPYRPEPPLPPPRASLLRRAIAVARGLRGRLRARRRRREAAEVRRVLREALRGKRGLVALAHFFKHVHMN
jgi:hypothetical protein